MHGAHVLIKCSKLTRKKNGNEIGKKSAFKGARRRPNTSITKLLLMKKVHYSITNDVFLLKRGKNIKDQKIGFPIRV